MLERKRICAVILLFLFTTGATVWGNSLFFDPNGLPPGPGYKPYEIIVKFKKPVADILEEWLSAQAPLETLQLTTSLDSKLSHFLGG